MGGPARLGGAGRRGPPVPGPGPAAGRATGVLLRRHPQRELGPVDPHPPAGPVRPGDRGARLDRAGDRGADHRGAGRGAARADLRALAGPGQRPRHPGRLDPRRIDADLLAGAHPAARLLPAAGPAARGRRVLPRPAVHPSADPGDRIRADRRAAHRQLADVRQHAGPSPVARPGRRRLPGRAAHPDDQGTGARHHRRHPCADGPRARVQGTDGVRPVRDEAGLEPGRRDAGAGLRLFAGQHIPGGGDLRLARPRRVRDGVDTDPRHARHPGGHPVHRAGLRGRQPGRGHRPGRDRPADPASMIEAPAPLPAQAAVVPRGEALRRGLRANPLMALGAVLCLLIVAAALLAPVLAPYPADAGSATHPFAVLQAPSSLHWFGTDNVGSDVLSRVIYGTRVSPLIAVLVLVIACVIGIPLGVVAGYFGGWLDEAIMRVTDIFLAFPPLLLALALAAVLPPSLTSLVIAIAVTWWPWYTRLIRGQAASVAGRPYVESCRALGIPSYRIVLRHILPNSVTPLIVQVSLDFGGVILTASALSFLGLGAQDPTPDWGLMVAEGQNYFTTAWWVVTFPGLAILVTAFAFALVGDGLRDLLDPKRIFLR